MVNKFQLNFNQNETIFIEKNENVVHFVPGLNVLIYATKWDRCMMWKDTLNSETALYGKRGFITKVHFSLYDSLRDETGFIIWWNQIHHDKTKSHCLVKPDALYD